MSHEYRSKWLQFCAYLHCANHLKYLRTELGADGKCVFCFADPQNKSANLEFQFTQDAQVSATRYAGSLHFLRREMSTARGETQNERQQNEHVSSNSHRQ